MITGQANWGSSSTEDLFSQAVLANQVSHQDWSSQ